MATQRRRNPVNTRRRTSSRRGRSMAVKSGVGRKLLMMLAVAAAVIFSVAIFFKVRTVEVQGNSVYDSQTVMDASGISAGDNLLAVNKAAVAGKLKAALPYVEQVRIARVLPDTIVLEVRESDAVFSVKADGGQNWLMSFSGRLLEQVTEETAQQHPSIVGFTVTGPEVGKQAMAENADALAAATSVLKQLQGTGIVEKVSKLDVSKPYDLILWYTDQYEIRLGGTDKMDYKVKYLLAVLEQLTDYQTGTIDLTFEQEKVARFIPW